MSETFRVLKTLLMVLCCAAFVGGASADTGKEKFRFGPRPQDGVFDPTDIITIEQRKEISEPLARILKNEGIDVMVVVLPEIGDVPAKHLANSFLENWKQTEVNAVVFYVPGEPESPWIFPGGIIENVVQPSVLKESVESAEKRARAESDEFGKIRAASNEAADIMRYWTGGAILRTEAIINERLARQLAFEKRHRLMKLAAILGAAGAIPIIVGIVFVVTSMKRRKPRRFPATRKISRLGAPYSGGNNANSRIK